MDYLFYHVIFSERNYPLNKLMEVWCANTSSCLAHNPWLKAVKLSFRVLSMVGQNQVSFTKQFFSSQLEINHVVQKSTEAN